MGATLTFTFAGTSNAASTLSSDLGTRGGRTRRVADGGTSTPSSKRLLDDRVRGTWSEYYTTGVTTPTFRDTDGHMTNWVVDGLGRPTQTQECTASTNQGQQCIDAQHWLTTNESWDADNNLIAATDARGNETDYSYDVMGNTTEIGEPVTQTSQGTFKPTKMYDYDAYNNVVGFCDQRRKRTPRTPIGCPVGRRSLIRCARARRLEYRPGKRRTPIRVPSRMGN